MFTGRCRSISVRYLRITHWMVRRVMSKQVDGSRVDYCIRSTLLITEVRRAATAVTCRWCMFLGRLLSSPAFVRPSVRLLSSRRYVDVAATGSHPPPELMKLLVGNRLPVSTRAFRSRYKSLFRPTGNHVGRGFGCTSHPVGVLHSRRSAVTEVDVTASLETSVIDNLMYRRLYFLSPACSSNVYSRLSHAERLIDSKNSGVYMSKLASEGFLLEFSSTLCAL